MNCATRCEASPKSYDREGSCVPNHIRFSKHAVTGFGVSEFLTKAWVLFASAIKAFNRPCVLYKYHSNYSSPAFEKMQQAYNGINSEKVAL